MTARADGSGPCLPRPAGTGEPPPEDVGASAQRRGVVVFDLDGVLFRGDTFVRFASRRFRSPVRIARAAAAVGRAQVRADHAAAHPHPLALLAGEAVRGMSDEEYHDAAFAFGTHLARSGRVVDDAVDEVRAHIRAGSEVVVATACEQTMAQAYVRGIGLDVVVVGSDLDPTTGAMVRHNRGEAKVAALTARGFSPPWHTAYSDSLSDAPMLRASRRPVLVNPSLALLRRAVVDLGPQVRWVVWQ